MSRQTPRKARHSRQPSNRIPAVSDYESDAAAIHTDSYAPPPPRTNTELNLSVLQRYLPTIHTILSIAANAVIYTFDSSTEGWKKSGVEGTMFVCAQSPLPEDPGQRPRACVFVLNRRGLDNVIVDLSRVSHAEVSGELVIMKVEGDWEEGDNVMGVWIHNDRDETREVASVMVHGKPEAEDSESETKNEDVKGKGKGRQKAEDSTLKPEAIEHESEPEHEVQEVDVPKTKDSKGKRSESKGPKVQESEVEDTKIGDTKIDGAQLKLPESEKSESAGSESDVDTA
ncbi:uncharacterized protein FIESC28_07746 [Fusarium coffeatum]|uniref:WH1 domain-containing protein n=1 Tax=Fusarium coffeatum TaxID=231269 RepID=A0A366RD96_9HYPO|nr:uncharacterized protein FIESC28_07746 [Fusarium coffeatum]RBR14316.1 hypothetical protein FIESC28_07746 [Fusarium coffeatum]